MNSSRLAHLDALRAIALFAVLMVHCHDYYNLFSSVHEGSWLASLAHFSYEYFLLGKAYLLFSFLFGLSFYLQLSRAESRGVDFRVPYIWRLIILMVFGFLHRLFYSGDILMIFAVMGLILVPLYKISTRWLWLLATIFLLAPQAMWNDYWHQSDFLFLWYEDLCRSIHLPSMPSSLGSSWWDLASWNIWEGLYHAFLYMIWSNRLLGVLSMLVLGIIAGRSGIMNKPRALAGMSLALLLLTLMIQGVCLSPLQERFPVLLKIFYSESYALFFAASLSLLLMQSWMIRVIRPLCAMGRCTLSCYISQSIVMTYLLAGWGLGLGATLSSLDVMTIGILLYLAQLLACALWMHYFQYGPLEGLWRRLTLLPRRRSCT